MELSVNYSPHSRTSPSNRSNPRFYYATLFIKRQRVVSPAIQPVALFQLTTNDECLKVSRYHVSQLSLFSRKISSQTNENLH
ncbi:hypothetical protein RB195_010375 [Necator americanus]|uniref:Uncharacterized protein n=1 Tax=Necator americanus TaxID=51031 RepID=A0ABR1CYX7_NECAM